MAGDTLSVPVALQEEWHRSRRFPDYEASSLGRVRRARAAKSYPAGYVLTPYPRRNGYLTVRLRSPATGRYVEVGVHAVVAEVFLGAPPAPDMEVDHWDDDKMNNCWRNLRWVTHAANMKKWQIAGVLWGSRDLASGPWPENSASRNRQSPAW